MVEKLDFGELEKLLEDRHTPKPIIEKILDQMNKLLRNSDVEKWDFGELKKLLEGRDTPKPIIEKILAQILVQINKLLCNSDVKKRTRAAKKLIEKEIITNRNFDLFIENANLPTDVKLILAEKWFEDRYALEHAVKNKSLPKEVRLLAAKKISETAIYVVIDWLMKEKDTVKDVKEFLTSKITDIGKRLVKEESQTKDPGRYSSLKLLAEDTRFPEEVRRSAAKELVEKSDRYDLMNLMSDKQSNSVKLLSVLKMIETADYFSLKRLLKDENLPENVRKLVKDKIVEVAKTVIESNGGYTALVGLARDESLTKEVRLLAKNNLIVAAERTFKWAEEDIKREKAGEDTGDSGTDVFQEIINITKGQDLPKNIRERAKKIVLEYKKAGIYS